MLLFLLSLICHSSFLMLLAVEVSQQLKEHFRVLKCWLHYSSPSFSAWIWHSSAYIQWYSVPFLFLAPLWLLHIQYLSFQAAGMINCYQSPHLHLTSFTLNLFWGKNAPNYSPWQDILPWRGITLMHCYGICSINNGDYIGWFHNNLCILLLLVFIFLIVVVFPTGSSISLL